MPEVWAWQALVNAELALREQQEALARATSLVEESRARERQLAAELSELQRELAGREEPVAARGRAGRPAGRRSPARRCPRAN